MSKKNLSEIINNLNGREIEKNVFRLRSWTPEQRVIRIKNVSRKIGGNETKKLVEEARGFYCDENFCKRTKINYANPDQQLIKAALFDYAANELGF